MNSDADIQKSVLKLKMGEDGRPLQYVQYLTSVRLVATTMRTAETTSPISLPETSTTPSKAESLPMSYGQRPPKAGLPMSFAQTPANLVVHQGHGVTVAPTVWCGATLNFVGSAGRITIPGASEGLVLD